MIEKHSFILLEIEKCLFTISSIHNFIKISLYPQNNLQTELDSAFLITNYIQLLIKSISKPSIELVKKIQEFEELFDILSEKYSTSLLFNSEEKKAYLKNLQLSLHIQGSISNDSALIYMRFLNYFIAKLNNKLYNTKLLDNKTNDIMSLSFICNILRLVSQSFHLYMLNSSEQLLFNRFTIPSFKRTIPEKSKTLICNSQKKVLFKYCYDNISKFSINKIMKFGYDNSRLEMFFQRNLTNLNLLHNISSLFDSIEGNFSSFFKDDQMIKYDQEFYINVSDQNDNSLYMNHLINIKTSRIRVFSNTYKCVSSKGIVNYLNLKLNMKRIFPQYTVILIYNYEENVPRNKYNMIKQILDENSFGKKTLIICIDYNLKDNNCELYSENLKVYEKIIMNIEEMFSIRKKKLVLLGDCDGVFLCLNLLKSVIERKLYLPNYLFLIYRNSRNTDGNMTDLNMIKDAFEKIMENHIHKSLLEFDKEELQLYENNLNFFSTDSNIISQFPFTYIILDPNNHLKEESYNLAEFLLQNQVQVQIIELSNSKQLI